MKFKVGIVTWFSAPNYGTFLQAYALQKYLNLKGIDNVILNYKSGGKYLSKIRDIIFKKCQISRKLFKRSNIKYIFSNFSNELLNITEVVTNENKYKYGSFCETYISGSDQIWSPLNFCSFFLLDFVLNKKKISYASSIGVNDIPKKLVLEYKRLLNNFDFISVREKRGKTIIENIGVNKDVLHVLDPIFLLDENQWVEKLEKNFKIEESYILCYFLGDICDYIKIIVQIKNNNKEKKLINIKIGKGNESELFDDEYLNVHPFLFLNLIKNSEFIVTDSYHGTLFGIIFKKKIRHVVRFKHNDPSSQNTRIYDFLNSQEISYVTIEINGITILEIMEFEYHKLYQKIVDSKTFLINSVKYT